MAAQNILSKFLSLKLSDTQFGDRIRSDESIFSVENHDRTWEQKLKWYIVPVDKRPRKVDNYLFVASPKELAELPNFGIFTSYTQNEMGSFFHFELV